MDAKMQLHSLNMPHESMANVGFRLDALSAEIAALRESLAAHAEEHLARESEGETETEEEEEKEEEEKREEEETPPAKEDKPPRTVHWLGRKLRER